MTALQRRSVNVVEFGEKLENEGVRERRLQETPFPSG